MKHKSQLRGKSDAGAGTKNVLEATKRREITEIEEKYKFIVNAHGEMMTLINSDYIYELVNDSWCRTFGRRRKDIIGKSVAEVWGIKRFKSEIEKKLDKCMKGDIFREEDSFIIAGGKKRYYEVSYYPFRNSDNKITHIVGVTNDITERKMAEIALKNSEKELRELNDKKDEYLSIINSDLENASSYVSSLLPDELVTSHLKIKWKIVPSTHLGGDTFGYHWIDEEHLALYMLDVTGHGVGSALHSVSALNILKYETLLNTNFRYPHEVLKSLNQLFRMTDHNSLFITMWYLVYNISTHELLYAGAGHPPLILFNSNGPPEKISSANIMIGVDEQIVFKSGACKIKGKTELYIYTDGAYEADLPDGKMMKIDDLVRYLSENRNKRSSEIEELYDHLVDLNSGSGLDDDFTIMKVSFL